MRRQHQVFLALLIGILGAGLPIAVALAQLPQFPNTFYGNVTDENGDPAPVGTVVTAVVNLGIIGSERHYSLGVTEPGKYGAPNGLQLKVGGDRQGIIAHETVIRFFLSNGTLPVPVTFGPDDSAGEGSFLDDGDPHITPVDLKGTIWEINATPTPDTPTATPTLTTPSTPTATPTLTTPTSPTPTSRRDDSDNGGDDPTTTPTPPAPTATPQIEDSTDSLPGGGGEAPTATPTTSLSLAPGTEVPTPTPIVVVVAPPQVDATVTPSPTPTPTATPTPTVSLALQDTTAGGGSGDGGFPWWGWVLIVLGVGAASVGVALYFLRPQVA